MGPCTSNDGNVAFIHKFVAWIPSVVLTSSFGSRTYNAHKNCVHGRISRHLDEAYIANGWWGRMWKCAFPLRSFEFSSLYTCGGDKDTYLHTHIAYTYTWVHAYGCVCALIYAHNICTNKRTGTRATKLSLPIFRSRYYYFGSIFIHEKTARTTSTQHNTTHGKVGICENGYHFYEWISLEWNLWRRRLFI